MEGLKLHHRLFLAVLFLWLTIIACSSSFTSPTTVPGPTGSVVYSSDESGNFEIYHMNINSLAKTRLTDNTAEDLSPFFLPPTQFGFVSDKSGKYQIYTVGLDGSEPKAWKKDDKRILFTPSVSPDGKKMVFVVQSNDKRSSLYMSNLDGSDEKRLTIEQDLEWDPSWSPDGKKIVFSSDLGGDFEIRMLNIDDGKATSITHNTFYDGHPRWSADGSRILFESDRDGDWEIYVIGIDEKNVKAITENSTGDWLANWSPDGKWIVYVSNRDGDDDLYIVGIDGKGQLKLTNNTAQDRYPTWVP